jgi:Ca-activated chloride channel family protein
VVLPVTVVDQRGEFVSDLDAGRFVLYDNGRPVPVQLFTNDDTPVAVGLILDNSRSMRRRMPTVVDAVLAFADLSNPEDEIFALRFDDEVRNALPSDDFLYAGNRDGLKEALTALVPGGRTALYDALMAGLARLDMSKLPRKVLVLVSDGGDNASRVAVLDEVLAASRRSNAAIYAIGLFDESAPDADPGVLKKLAHATGGERFLPETPQALSDVCRRIARTIRSGYTIGFEPPSRDGGFHRVEVKIQPPDPRRLSVKTRPGYTAPHAAAKP